MSVVVGSECPRRFQITGAAFSSHDLGISVSRCWKKKRSDVPRISRRGCQTTMRARANTGMAPDDERGGHTRESDRIAPDTRRTDSEESDCDPPLAFAVEPMRSNEQLERFASFTEAVRDALGEFGGVKELSPDEAAKQGCLSTLRSLHRRGRAELTVGLCASAAKGGQLKVLQWLRENECPWEEDTCRAATKGGHLEVLKWARANGCPWDEETCAWAAENGHLEVLKWAHANGAPLTHFTREKAVANGHREVVQWLEEIGE